MSDGRDFFCIFVIVFSFPAKIRHTRGASKLIGSFQLVSVLNSHTLIPQHYYKIFFLST